MSADVFRVAILICIVDLCFILQYVLVSNQQFNLFYVLNSAASAMRLLISNPRAHVIIDEKM